MQVTEITPTLMKKCLHAFSHYKDPPDSLLGLHCLGVSRTRSEQVLALHQFLTKIALFQLTRLRTSVAQESLGHTKAGGQEWAELLMQMERDFQTGDHELQSWSALYYHFFALSSFGVSELASHAHVHERTFRRRVEDGISYLSNYLRRAELEAHSLDSAKDYLGITADQGHLVEALNRRGHPVSAYYDDFSSYPIGASPSGWLVQGGADIVPTVEERGGRGKDFRVVCFLEVPWQYKNKWLIRDNLMLAQAYVITARLNFQTKIADRAGVTFAWNPVNSDHVDVQANIYWQRIEVEVAYSGSAPSGVVVASTRHLDIKAFSNYWLKIVAKDFGPGRGQVQVYWSEDGIAFEQAVLVTGLPDLTGFAGLSTAGPHLPPTHFAEFHTQWL
jgi:hypothetical protein